jgi:hypothetical protein
MALNRDNWPTRDRIKADLTARFSLPAASVALETWFAFARQAIGMDLVLIEHASADDGRSEQALEPHAFDEERFDMHAAGEQMLDALEVIDLASAFAAMDGYRFVLDQKNSTPDALIWTDQVDSGQWRPEWVVIESIGADPIIADLSQPQIPILWDMHGSGRWSPQPMFDSLSNFIAALEVRPPQPQTFTPSALYSVVITNFGPNPKRGLLALKRLPTYSDHSPAKLLALLEQTPFCVIDKTISEPLAKRIAQLFLECGAKVKIDTHHD